MKIELLTSMSGDDFSHDCGAIIDTALFVTPTSLTAKQIAEEWIAAGIAKRATDEKIVAADNAQLAVALEQAEALAADTRIEVELIAAEKRQLEERVKVLEPLASGEAEKLASEQAKKIANLEKQLSEREEQLGNLREKLIEEVRAAVAPELVEIERAAEQLEASTDTLVAAVSA